MRRPRVLFLCTGNACRSQMAEGWTRALLGDQVEVYSAGIEAHGLDPRAVVVMREAGVEISEQRSQTIDELEDQTFDLVITVCDHAHERCPVLPGAPRTLHRGFPDPPRLAAQESEEQARLEHYRRVRDEIRDFVTTLPALLGIEPA